MYELNNPNWKLKEYLKGEKKINGLTVKLYDNNVSELYVEIVYDNFKITNYIQFIKTKTPKLQTDYMRTNFSSLIYGGEIFYYKVLKFYQVFLKWGYYSKFFFDSVPLYNEVYDFREKIGSEYNKMCLIENKLTINETSELKKEYKKLFKSINKKSKDMCDKVINKYSKYLDIYLRFY